MEQKINFMMKQKLILIIIISVFTLFVKISNAQSFLTQDKIWSDYYHSDYYNMYDDTGKFLGWTTAKVTTWYKVGADSLIEGTLYKQILISRDFLMQKWSLAALMREEGNKVFQYDSYYKTENLLYDFGMQPGDTLFDANGYIATVLQSVSDTIIDRTRKVFNFLKCEYGNNPQHYVEETWIEGIGALRGGIFRPLYDFSTGGSYHIGYRGTICYFENGEIVYHNTDFDKCYYNEIKPLSGDYIPEIKVQMSALSQNAPNPFTNETEIKYFVAPGIKEAYICIFDIQGKMLQKINVAPGQNRVMIHGSALTPGMYLYSLFIDGQEVDAKRMILTK